jgi:hypothetical protein
MAAGHVCGTRFGALYPGGECRGPPMSDIDLVAHEKLFKVKQ